MSGSKTAEKVSRDLRIHKITKNALNLGSGKASQRIRETKVYESEDVSAWH